MAFNSVASNQYKFPPGYRTGVFCPYKVWNGLVTSLNSPGASVVGAVMNFLITAPIADLGNLQFYNPLDFTPYLFQFVRAGTTPTMGFTVAVPADGGTPAQVAAALGAAMNQASGVDVDSGDVVPFPWKIQTIGTQVRLYFTTPGNPGSYSSSDGVTISTLTQTELASGSAAPGRIGMFGSFLPGSV